MSAEALAKLEKLQVATATKPVRKLGTRKGTVVQAALWANNGRKSGYLKLLDLAGIAKEALCWALARNLGLPMPQAYFVFANPDDLPEIKSGNSHNMAFGLEGTGIYRNRISNRRTVESQLEDWRLALECGIFDEWIVNRDRIPNNLLFSGKNNFYLIDHDEALQAYASVESYSQSQILRQLGENRTESERQVKLERAAYFLRRIQKLDWERVKLMVDHENVPEIQSDMFSRHIEFLQQRASVLPAIVSSSLGIKQMRLNLTDEVREKEERFI